MLFIKHEVTLNDLWGHISFLQIDLTCNASLTDYEFILYEIKDDD